MIALITAVLNIWWPTCNQSYANEYGDRRSILWVLNEKKASVVAFVIAYLVAGFWQFKTAAVFVKFVSDNGTIKGVGDVAGFWSSVSSCLNAILFAGLIVWAFVSVISKADKTLSRL